MFSVILPTLLSYLLGPVIGMPVLGETGGGAFRRSCIVPSPCPAGMLSLRNSSGEEFLGFVLMRFAELILKIACVSYPIHYPTAFSIENRRWMYPPISTQNGTDGPSRRTMKTAPSDQSVSIDLSLAVIRGMNYISNYATDDI